MFRSSFSNNAFSLASLKDSQKNREWFVFGMKLCLLWLFCKIATKFNRFVLHLNNVFLLDTTTVGLFAFRDVTL